MNPADPPLADLAADARVFDLNLPAEAVDAPPAPAVDDESLDLKIALAFPAVPSMLLLLNLKIALAIPADHAPAPAIDDETLDLNIALGIPPPAPHAPAAQYSDQELRHRWLLAAFDAPPAAVDDEALDLNLNIVLWILYS